MVNGSSHLLIIIVFCSSLFIGKNIHKVMKSWIHVAMEWFGLECPMSNAQTSVPLAGTFSTRTSFSKPIPGGLEHLQGWVIATSLVTCAMALLSSQERISG